MKRLTLLVTATVAFALMAGSAFAETRVVGNQSGVWSRDGSPFIATGNITVQNDRALEIEPGVEVRFEGNYSLFVYGRLVAVGAEGDSILFAPIAGGEVWAGIRFLTADSATILDYCVVTGGRALAGEGELDTLGAGGNIFISGGDVRIDHSRISRGRSRVAGGGIAIWRANTTILNTLINENESTAFGGGVAVAFNAAPLFVNCRIGGNATMTAGGGVWVFAESRPRFLKCVFQTNRTTNAENGSGGGAFAAEASSPQFQTCEFLENLATAGGGIYVRGAGTNPLLEWCYFYGNAANAGARVGGAIYVRGGASPTIRYCRLVENNANYGGGLYAKEPPRFSVTHCLFLRNAATRAGGAVAAALDLGETPLRLDNCTFINNRNIGEHPIAHTAYGRLPGRDPGSFIRITSSIVWGATPLFGEEGRVMVGYSNVVNGFAGDGNTSDNPGFYAADSVWFLLSGDSRCVDSGDSTLPVDSDGSRNDRGWLHFPHDARRGLPEDPLFAELSVVERASVPLRFRNNTGVPIYVTPMDRWNEGAREMFINATTLTGDSQLHAVAWTETGFYLAGGNSGQDPNYVYKLDEGYNLRERFEQPGGQEGEGFTDLATDGGSVLYGAVEDFVIEFTTDGEFGQDYRVPEELRVCRGIGSDFNYSEGFVDFYLGGEEGSVVQADAGMFWRGATTVGDTIVALGVKGNTRAVYAVTEIDAGRAMLWLVTPDDGRATPLYTLSLPEGLRQGGIEVTQNFRQGRGKLIGILEGDADNGDRLYALDLYTSWLVIQPRLRLMMPGEDIEWQIVFAGDQMPAGFYEGTFYLTVNGYGEGGEVRVAMRSNPVTVGGADGLQPGGFILNAPYPNPFNSQARVGFRLQNPSFCEVWLTDASGRSVQRLMGGFLPAGEHLAWVDASALPAGAYFVRLALPGRTMVKPLTVLK